ncbi:MAG: hypothetical protein LBJ71_04775 [Holosporaceae bacterium]|nr:hypothetical protein [Holosporaceae bacterium]
MKRLVLIALVFVVNVKAADSLVVYNNTQDSFSVTKDVKNDRYLVMEDGYLESGKPETLKLSPDSNLGYWGLFSKGKLIEEEDRPSLLFRNAKGGFKILFMGCNSAKLLFCTDVSQTGEITLFNNEQTDSYNYGYTAIDKSRKIGKIINWLVSDCYRVVYCNEPDGRGRAVIIENVGDNNSWMTGGVDEDAELHAETVTGIEGAEVSPQPQSKRHWWSRLCCRCTD